MVTVLTFFLAQTNKFSNVSCVCVCRYRLAGLPGDYQEKNISSPETNYCLLKDLIIWTQYQIQVAAYTGAGLGVYSNPVTEYTLQGGE